MDTGVDLAHPDLRRKWRGGADSWFDPHDEEAAPYDALGHGTQAMGIIAGGSGLGVAPDARWIAVKLYNADGRARMSDIHQAFQWLMDPDGDPATADAPDIVNASWSLSGRGAGLCIAEFSDDIQALRSAGIAVVFAAGNDGPAPGTGNSPGNNPGALSVGAVDRGLEVARQTSRGPSASDGAVFPRLVAPGVNVRTTDVSHGGLPSYTTVSGSSLAAPHVAGVLALLAGAFPEASVAELETALVRAAHDLGDAGADNHYGHGLVDALAAFNALRDGRASAADSATVPGDLMGMAGRGTTRPMHVNKLSQDGVPVSAMPER
jgi:bacillopeptidase F